MEYENLFQINTYESFYDFEGGENSNVREEEEKQNLIPSYLKQSLGLGNTIESI